MGVGFVISGESFGWNQGWKLLGFWGFLGTVGFCILLYSSLIQVKIRLALLDPSALGPHIHAKNSSGVIFGNLVAYFTCVEFLFASPAIANTLGEYIAFLFPALSSQWISFLFLVAFCSINLFSIQISAIFIVLLTLFAIAELGLYFLAVSSPFSFSYFANLPDVPFQISSFLQGIPFAMWLFLGIEGISLVSSNIGRFKFREKLVRGYWSAYCTLVLLALLVLFLTAGSFVWDRSSKIGFLH